MLSYAKCLHGVYCIYERNKLFMILLSSLEINFHNPKHIMWWKDIRNHFVEHRMPLQYGLSQWAFASMALCSIPVLSWLLMWALTIGTFMFSYLMTYWFFFFAMASSIMMFIFLRSAVQIWAVQSSHVEMIKEEIVQIRLQHGEQAEYQLETLQALCKQLKASDQPPALFGVSITPAIFTVLRGAITSLTLAIFGVLGGQ
jgi:hypothetical protein